jgi:hypothetical protein
MAESYTYFSHGYITHEHFLQYATFMWHFDMKSNKTEGTFNTTAKALDYGQQE